MTKLHKKRKNNYYSIFSIQYYFVIQYYLQINGEIDIVANDFYLGTAIDKKRIIG